MVRTFHIPEHLGVVIRTAVEALFENILPHKKGEVINDDAYN
jgi:hypothetical protein